MKFDKLGWVVAAGLLGAFVASGFQANALKMGTVDIAKVFNENEFTKTQTSSLQTMGKARQDIMDYLGTYRVARAEDAQKFRDLSLKANPTAADKAALDAVKAQIQQDDAKYRDLATKATPTPEEKKLLDDYNQRGQTLTQLQQRWGQEFDAEVSGTQGKLRQQALDKVKAAIGDVAKNQGYNIVFDSAIAPYSSNDLTVDALKIVNKK